MTSEHEPVSPSPPDRLPGMAPEQLTVMLRAVAEDDAASARCTMAKLLASPLFDIDRSVNELTDVAVCALLDITGDASPSEITTSLLGYVDIDRLCPYEKIAARIVLAGLFGDWNDIDLQINVAAQRDDVEHVDVLVLLAHIAAATLQRWSACQGRAH